MSVQKNRKPKFEKIISVWIFSDIEQFFCFVFKNNFLIVLIKLSSFKIKIII